MVMASAIQGGGPADRLPAEAGQGRSRSGPGDQATSSPPCWRSSPPPCRPGQPGHDDAVAAVDDAKTGDEQPGAGQGSSRCSPWGRACWPGRAGHPPGQPAEGQQHRQAPERQRPRPVQILGKARGEHGPERPPPSCRRRRSPSPGAPLGEPSLMRPGSTPCTRAEPSPHRAALAMSRAPLARSRRRALPRASSSRAVPSRGRGPVRPRSAGVSSTPTPISQRAAG
jgi:hypothetical protein